MITLKIEEEKKRWKEKKFNYHNHSHSFMLSLCTNDITLGLIAFKRWTRRLKWMEVVKKSLICQFKKKKESGQKLEKN